MIQSGIFLEIRAYSKGGTALISKLQRFCMWFDTTIFPTDRADGVCKFQTVEILAGIPLDNWTLDLSQGSNRPIFRTTTPKGVAVNFGTKDGHRGDPYVALTVDGKNWSSGISSWTCPVAALWKRLAKQEPFRTQMRQSRDAECAVRRQEEQSQITQTLKFPTTL